MDKPYLSIIATSRNDSHGGNILKRMRLFVNGLLRQTREFNVPAELIMVEWNPPADRPLLHTVLPKPGPDDKMLIRYVQVPSEIQEQFIRKDVVPLYQMIAKNVGIRRAKGDFILCTNIDLLFSDKLFEELATKDLNKDEFYRANRVDIPDEIEEDWPWEKMMEFADNNKMRRLGKDYRYHNITEAPSWIYKWAPLARFVNQLYKLKRHLLEKEAYRKFNDLDTQACGDFTMMHRDAWEDIQGYVELDLYSIHIDTLGLLAAASLGYKQHIFHVDACAYHIDHPTGWEAMSPIDKIKFSEERPGLGFDVVWETGMHVLMHKTHFNVNPPTWGYSDREFEEVIIKPGVEEPQFINQVKA